VIDDLNPLFTHLSNSMIQLSISLSKGCKLSSNVNDELCSIYQDGGDHFAVMDIHGLFT
jgi:hypothetical protein